MKDFMLIAFTPEVPVENEAVRIVNLLNEGYSYVHLRHPSLNAEDIEHIILSIPTEYHSRIKLHAHPEMAEKYGCGLHLNHRLKKTKTKTKKRLSQSCHSIEEAEQYSDYEYVTLSPIFPSISKPGYSNPDILNAPLPKNVKIIALGGVTPERFSLLKEKGFAGAALLGHLWHNP